MVVARPDGKIGTICALEDGASVSRYSERFVTDEKRVGLNGKHVSDVEPGPNTAGEVDLEREKTRGNKRVVYQTA